MSEITRSYKVICIIISYFLVSWLVPWHLITLPYELSLASGFDILFVVSLGVFFKLRIRMGWRPSQLRELILPTVLAISAITYIHFAKIVTPFSYIKNVFLHMVIIAPLLEELVFRYIFQNLVSKSTQNKNITIMVSAILFSLSHAYALTFLPKDFYPFIYLQIFYTFGLGLFCAKSFYNNNFLSPYFIHFIFNLIFYSSLKFALI